MNNLETTLLKKTINEIIDRTQETFANKDFFESYIRKLELYLVSDNLVYLTTENNFSKQILTNDYLSTLESEINVALKSNYQVKFISKGEKILDKLRPTGSDELVFKISVHEGLNPRFRLDNFYVSSFNKNVWTAAKTIIDSNFLNPLFICGGVGLGKTHLLHAVGNEFVKKFPNKSAKYISSDDFSREIYSAFSSEDKLSIEKLKSKYENYDLLMVDDIQMLAKRDKINEILFGIFNNNIAKNKYIVWACDKNPDHIVGFEDRMKSRFYSGLFVTIGKPDLNVIKKIIENKIKQINPNYSLTTDAVNFLSHRNKGDIRRLEGDLHQIVFYATNNLPPSSIISLDVIQTIFNQNNFEEIKSYGFDVDPNIIINQICLAYGVKDDMVKSKSRLKYLTAPRGICMYVLRKKYNMTFAQIGHFFSGRNHSTIMEAIEKIEKVLKSDESLGVFIENIYKKI